MEKTNFCKRENGFSKCTLENIKDQYTCRFFIKASKSALYPENCRYYRPEYDDNHCDNPNAQKDAEKSVVKKDEKTPTDFSY